MKTNPLTMIEEEEEDQDHSPWTMASFEVEDKHTTCIPIPIEIWFCSN